MKTIALLIHVSNGSIEQWERGLALPTEDKLPAISEAYDLKLPELRKIYYTSKTASQEEGDVRKNI